MPLEDVESPWWLFKAHEEARINDFEGLILQKKVYQSFNL